MYTSDIPFEIDPTKQINQSSQTNQTKRTRQLKQTKQTKQKKQTKRVKIVEDSKYIVSKGFIINAAHIPSIMAHRKLYENRTFEIQSGYYALYASKSKKKMLDGFLAAIEEEKQHRNETIREIGRAETNIVGVLHVKQVYCKNDRANYPDNVYADINWSA